MTSTIQRGHFGRKRPVLIEEHILETVPISISVFLLSSAVEHVSHDPGSLAVTNIRRSHFSHVDLEQSINHPSLNQQHQHDCIDPSTTHSNQQNELGGHEQEPKAKILPQTR